MLTFEPATATTYLVRGLPEGSFAKIAKQGALWEVWHSSPGKTGRWSGRHKNAKAAFLALAGELAQRQSVPPGSKLVHAEGN